MKGYHLIEHNHYPMELIDSGIPDDVVITIMHWLVSLLRNDEYLKTLPVEIEVIAACYTGKYPCIAIHYLQKLNVNIEKEVLSKIENYCTSLSFASFYNHIKENSKDIQKTINEYNT